MAVTLKPIGEQVIVLTGATSGIGLVTARMAAKRGASLLLAARNYDALTTLANELRESGSQVETYALDVADEAEVQRMGEHARTRFGRIDTWVNNAGVSVYGRLEDTPDADSRRLFDTNFWGLVNGSLTAVRHMKESGGALINIGSALSDRAIPIQGMYCASKHAVKGFTDALRMELEADGAPISVTLIKPAAIDTPYKEHAKNLIGVKAENPPPVYAPETVAEAILHCAENSVRDVFVGGGGKALSVLGNMAPGLTDTAMKATMIDLQADEDGVLDRSKESLYTSADSSLAERGGYGGHVAETSLYTKASLNPVAIGAALAIGLGAAFALTRRFKSAGEATRD